MSPQPVDKTPGIVYAYIRFFAPLPGVLTASVPTTPLSSLMGEADSLANCQRTDDLNDPLELAHG
jgi:hypothetical protein